MSMRAKKGSSFGGTCLVCLRDAALISTLASVLGLMVNLVHPEGISLVAQQEYQTMVPCPVFGGEVQKLTPHDPSLVKKTTFLIDAREASVFDDWSLRGAVNVTFDYLDPTPPEVILELAQKIASSRAQRVVVFGDGARPDTGEQLGRDIAGHGIKNVHYVEGGAPALRAQKEKL